MYYENRPRAVAERIGRSYSAVAVARSICGPNPTAIADRPAVVSRTGIPLRSCRRQVNVTIVSSAGAALSRVTVYGSTSSAMAVSALRVRVAGRALSL